MCYKNSSKQQDLILPIVAITVFNRNKPYKFNCLVDTGSQRSYFSRSVLTKVKGKRELIPSTEFRVKTFLGTKQKKLREVMFDVGFNDFYRSLPVLVDDDFDIEFNLNGFHNVVENLIGLNYKLAANFGGGKGPIPIHGLLGVDLIQFMGPMQMIKCMDGFAWQIPEGVIPFGSVQNFLTPNQMAISKNRKKATEDNFCTVMSQYSSCPITHVNFVLEPKGGHVDPFAENFNESFVERNLEKTFSIESLGLPNEDPVSDYDKEKIERFEKSIKHKDNCYYVKLAWDEDKIKSVPSNHAVALNVLNRVVKKLEQQNLYEEYAEIFNQQEEEGIIEQIDVAPDKFEDHIWIPHRPVFKSEDQTTTKIRPVFNCSLKTNGAPSLNEAAYPGINLMGNMLELLLMFRTNQYVLLADIRKAFLMIKLEAEEDKNRFCFFMKKGQSLVCYRYTTLIFGFVASPFILNYVIKHHANKYPKDECTEMLKKSFYVDNLVKTSNSPEKLLYLYQESIDRMSAGNFDLRSCNSNCEELKAQMKKDGNFVEHGCELEKVLGYRYNPSRDTIQVASSSVNEHAKTKRNILSQISAIYDPLSLYLPITIKGRILVSELWLQRMDWDCHLCRKSNCLV